MDNLGLYNVPFDEPLFSNANPSVADIANAHHFITRTSVTHPNPEKHSELTADIIQLDVYEICDGIYVSVTKPDVGPAAQANQTQINTQYWDSRRLTDTFQQQSRAEQERDYLLGIQKMFQYFENKLSSSPSIRKLFQRLKFEEFIGIVDPSSREFGRINNSNNSVEVYIPGRRNPVGYKRASVIMMPPNSIESLTMAFEASVCSIKPGLGSYGIVQIDPFISNDVVNYPGEIPAKFAESPVLALLHELIHVTHDLRGLSTPLDEGLLSLNPPVLPASPQWSKRLSRVTADEPNLKKNAVPFEELLTFNQSTVSSNLTKGRRQTDQYIARLVTGVPAGNQKAEFKGAVEQIETELLNYYGVNLSQEFVGMVSHMYGITYNWVTRRFNVGPGPIRRYVTSAFDITEKMLATELNISTRRYYVAAGDYHDAAVYFVNILDDNIFNVNEGLVSQDPLRYTPLPVVTRKVSERVYRRRGYLRRILCNDMTFHGVPVDTEFSEVESDELNENSAISTDIDRVESLAAEDIPNDLKMSHSSNASVGNDIFELSTEYNGPDYILDDQNVIGGEFTVEEPIGAMINGIMLSPDEEEPVFNRDLMGALDSENEIYAPKIKAMDTLGAKVNAGLGYLGWVSWAATIFSDIVDSIRVKQINYAKFAQDFMMLIPFYCAYTNASEGEYEKAMANAEIDAFSLFASDGAAAANIQLFVASLAINTMYPILQKEEAYTQTMDNFINKYKDDIDSYLFNAYGQWDMNVADRLLNESYIAANGLSNMLLTIKRVMVYDQKHNGYSDDDQKKIAALNEEMFESFPKIIAIFQHNSMVANMHNAGQMFSKIMWPQIQEAIETYSNESESYFSDFLEKSYKDGIIGAPAYQRYKAKIADTFNGSASLNMTLDLFKKRVAEVTQSPSEYGSQLDTLTSRFGNLVHLDVTKSAALEDLYSKFNVIADSNILIPEIGREDHVIRIKGDQISGKTALVIAAKSGFAQTFDFQKKQDYTVGFWVRIPRQIAKTISDGGFFECELKSKSGPVKELTLGVGADGLRLDVLNNVSGKNTMVANSGVYNQWTHIMVSHDSTKVNLYVNGVNVSTRTKIERVNEVVKQPSLTFSTLDQDYLIDNVCFYKNSLNDNQAEKIYDNEITKLPKDYWGERLEYNKAYYLKCDYLPDSSFEDAVPLQLIRTGTFMENNKRFPYLYKGIKIELEYKYEDNKRYVEPDDEFFIKFSGRSTYFAIRDTKFWFWSNVKPILNVTDLAHISYAETFKMSFLKRKSGTKRIHSKHAYYNRIVGIGADNWRAYRGTAEQLWFWGSSRYYNGNDISTFSLTYDHLVKATEGDRVSNVMWGFVPEDPGWIEK